MSQPRGATVNMTQYKTKTVNMLVYLTSADEISLDTV